MTAIETKNLSKRYGEVSAVEEFELTVKRGEVFGFLGPNGAGKSTTIDLFLDLVRPTDGHAVVAGRDPREDPRGVRKEVGILPDDYSLYESLTGKEHIELAIEMNGSDEAPNAVLSRVGLTDAGHRYAGNYSKGMSQRLALGMALVGDPSVLILDEPTSGIDPNGVREMREIIREEADRGTTVFFSTHILEQVEEICDRVGIVRDGELVAVDTIEGLRNTVHTRSTLTLSVDSVPPDHGVSDIEGVTSVERTDGRIEVECTDPAVKSSVITAVEAAGASVTDIDIEETSLSELFGVLTTGGETE